MLGTITTDCCCDVPTGPRYVAMPCWDSRSRVFNAVLSSPFTTTFFATNAAGNPPQNTRCALVLIGAGGAGNTIASGGGGAYIETQFTTRASTQSNTMRIGHAGAITNVGATVFGGGAQGASFTRYGGGASAYRNGESAPEDFIAAGGGGAASSLFASQTNEPAVGGSGGTVLSARPSTDASTAGSASQTVGGAGGVTGGAAGQLGTLPTAGNGGAGASLGGGGGGGRAAGGGGGNQGTRGGAGTGGASLNFNPAISHSGRDGYTQASPYTNIGSTRGIGDGGIGLGNAGRGVIAWRRCPSQVCPEVPEGLPPALHICITDSQLNNLKTAAGTDACDSPYLAFKYQGWPFYIAKTPPQVVARPCDRLATNADLSAPRWVASANYCETIYTAQRTVQVSGCAAGCGSPNCAATIYFCDEYRHQIGMPPCILTDGKCHWMSYQACDYLVTGTVDANCDPPTPFNVGIYNGTTNPPCTGSKPFGQYDVGPFVFTGGFQCGSDSTVKFTWDGSGLPWYRQSSAACKPYVGPWTGHFTMNCLYHLTGDDVDGCWAVFNQGQNWAPCQCTSNFSDVIFGGECVHSVDRWDIVKEGLCPPVAGVPQCQDPCICYGHRAIFRGCENGAVGVQRPILVGAAAADCTGNGWVTALTITRNCPHPNGGSAPWATVDGCAGTVNIDNCLFQGNGTALDFANAINAALGDRLTATASPNYWLGPRWRGTDTYPFDKDCQSGPCGDEAMLVSYTDTQIVFAMRWTSLWKACLEVFCQSGTGLYPLAYPDCVCSANDCFCKSEYLSVGCVIEKPNVPANLGDLKPLALVAGSEQMCDCQVFNGCDPSALPFPQQVT